MKRRHHDGRTEDAAVDAAVDVVVADAVAVAVDVDRVGPLAAGDELHPGIAAGADGAGARGAEDRAELLRRRHHRHASAVVGERRSGAERDDADDGDGDEDLDQ